MYLVYKPEGQDEPTRWKYDFRRLNTMEREAIERRTGLDFAEWTTKVLRGNSTARRALLFTFLRRDHPGIKWEDVQFEWDEVRLEYSRSEWLLQRKDALANLKGDELAITLERIDKELETAWDDTEETGKAQRPIAE
ncbi:hypothetical protein RM780_07840 [Streptomyces sp. DSM 44917]|uniref:Integrase n=1 Tax=Streptomyces boetiae TaxID=3075541 RepID=A0ABU2L5M9_9ACTN|nr:hypothetical protein [Streptomyces sp. DSM 44917]MDT0306874.1 hypothetical protein [Streptomyces sp. DSM 44917]